MARFVADLGNSRLKWALVGPDAALVETVSLPVDGDAAVWARVVDGWSVSLRGSQWAIASVNPPLEDRLGTFLTAQRASAIRWYRSAGDVPVRHALTNPETTGADRALAVWAAIRSRPQGPPGLVVSCGTAITIERISSGVCWEGGAIAAGIGLLARGLHDRTALLPLVIPPAAPTAWGRDTKPAIAAGVFWGAVGTIRELIARQSEGLSPDPWVVWTGGDAASLAPWVCGPTARIEPDLVLRGLAELAFSGPERASP